MTDLDTDDYHSIFLNNTPLLDVRAPVEFARGAFPNSRNLPLLDDSQREKVGTCYKRHGQDAAIELGLKLATREIREHRVLRWTQFIKKHPDGCLYCFRGGLRSRTSQTWLKQNGIDYPLIKGGYKAMRGYLLQQLDINIERIPWVILCGMTGSGKTRVLKKIRFHIDLEGLANHRGSAFGRDHMDFQPTQINWENQFSIDCLKHQYHHPSSGLVLEDEGKFIGRITLPPTLYKKMEQSPRIFLERDLEQRVQIICEEYISDNWPLYQRHYHEKAHEMFSSFVLDNLFRIKNRLGGTRYTQIKALFKQGLNHLFDSGQSHVFKEGIRLLLAEYYDPMYRYQLKKKPVKLTFQGSETEILDWTGHTLQHMNSHGLHC